METEFNGIYISCDGCRFCDDLHRDTDGIINKYVKKHKSINVDDIKNDQDKKLIAYLKPKQFPTFAVFKKILLKNVYVGRIIGYNGLKDFLSSLDRIKKHAEKSETPLVIGEE